MALITQAEADRSFKQAKHYHTGRVRGVRAIVLHSMEAPEKGTTAESTQDYFTRVDRPASAHRNFDNNTVANSVKLWDTAFAAPGLNADGVQYEHAGYARQTRAEWLDAFGQSMLDISAQVAAMDAKRYSIPIRWLTLEQVKDEKSKGFTSHHAVSLAFRKSTHTDPGNGFPVDWYLDRVAHYFAGGAPLSPGGIPVAFDPNQPALLVKAGSPEECFVRSYIKGATKQYEGQPLANFQIISFDPAGPAPSPIPPHSVGVGTFVPGWADVHDTARPDRYGTLHALMDFLGL